MWLKRLIESPDVNISTNKSNNILELDFMSSISRTIKAFMNRKLLNILGADNQRRRESLFDSFKAIWWIERLKTGELSLSDFWYFIDFWMLIHNQSDGMYKFFNTSNPEGISLANILDPSDLINTDISFINRQDVFHSQVCRYTHIDNNSIIGLNVEKTPSIPYILVELNGVIIGHIKLKWQKTFLSYVNAKDSDGNISLIKWWIYWISYRYVDLLDNRVADIDNYNYVFQTKEFHLFFKEISKFWKFSEKLEEHIERIWEKENIYIK